ncbi:geranylgeranyl pyrophosphate synthetase [Plectosphaerella plurivora]|uniref:Geranylgeranyl pyrophosphate synthetase n=1 Tax=Plectosphaerella plurivora TaxID=936078 RepID=A0A9P8V0H1_9PEZI|nr:geranylgeranyl pyrophosphate synthetase [Plectosphaerella plurivora]
MSRRSDSPEDTEAKETGRGAVWIPTHLRPSSLKQPLVHKDPQNLWTDRGRGQGRGRGRGGYRGRGGGDGSRIAPEKPRGKLQGKLQGTPLGQSEQRWTTRGRGKWPGQGRGYSGAGKWPGQGRGSSTSPSTPNDPSPSSQSPPRHPLGSLIKSLTTTDLADTPKSPLKLTGFHPLTSYNWLDNRTPSIVIPGTPRRWSPSPPRRLPWDSGTFYRDHDALLHPSHPTQPAIEALLCTPAPSTTAPVDLVACSHTLFNLYCFAAGETRHFRMLVETIGGAIHLIRRENPEDEKIPDVHGFGHTFVDANMVWEKDVLRSLLHRRIIRHDFAGISTIVRFVADGYLPDKVDKAPSAPKTPLEKPSPEKTSLEKTVSPKPSSSKTPSSKPSLPKSSSISITSAGQPIPHSALFDLKTRSIRRDIPPETLIAEYLPRLWLCQIPNFIIGRHNRGLFTDITIHDIRPDLTRWESEHQETLARFAKLLRKIMALAQARGDGKLEINYEEGASVLEIREQMPGIPSSLPVETEKRWKEWLAEIRETKKEKAGSDDDGGRLDESVPDYTACSSEGCGYCGHCSY